MQRKYLRKLLNQFMFLKEIYKVFGNVKIGVKGILGRENVFEINIIGS